MEGEIHEKQESLKKKIWDENKKMWIVSGPAILSRVSTFGVHVVSQAFIGHFSSSELAAYALVFTILFRFYLGTLMGVNGGLGTLCGQAYGAKQYHKLGTYLQQQWLILLVITALLSPLFVFAAPILKALGQDEHIAEGARTLALWFIPVIFLYAICYSCNTYLQAQSKNFILSCFAVLSFLQHILVSWLLAVKFEFGVGGVMVSTVLAYLVPNVGQLAYIMCGGCRETWRGFTTACFEDLGLIIKLSFSSGVMICLEFCYTTVLILLTGNMGDAEVTVDALSICLNISGWALMISFGFLASASVRVSNELGRRDAKAAKLAIVVSVLTSFVIGLVLFTLFLVFKESAAYMFTKSPAVAKAVARLSPLLAVTILLGGLQPALSGVASGAGRQGVVAYVNLGSYYLIGVPLGVVLGHVFDLQVKGVWIGMIIGIVFQTCVLIIMTCTTNWDEQVALAQIRINKRSSTTDQTNDDVTT
ncbi:protein DETOXIFICATION 21-like [Salvia miltiorrhiza]|uniref:protein DETOXIFICATION 21-like n=1 Tax=Salvia miltiorrhiza TaxID=226208 RepID=UPI0025AD2A48|nr:protein DETOXIFICATION 21-like [Salvia miltiorrhiza]